MTLPPAPQDSPQEVSRSDMARPLLNPPGGVARFGVFLLLAVGLAVAWCVGLDQSSAPVKSRYPTFEPERSRAMLQQEQPVWVLVSNSMLTTRLREAALSRRSQQKAGMIWWHGSRSAFWFLAMKRLVAEAPVKPKVVSLFFRCTDLTWADQKITEQQAIAIAALEGLAQPEWRQVLGAGEDEEAASSRGRVKAGLNWLFPCTNLSYQARQSVQNKSLRATRFGSRMTNSQRRAELNERFSLAHLRHDLGNEGTLEAGGASVSNPGEDEDDARNGAGQVDPEELPNDYLDGPRHFDPSPEVSFLPHMVALAKKEGILLHFHRVKQRPTEQGSVRDSPAIQRYMTDLRRYLTGNSCIFTDESGDPALTLDMYADGDHIAHDPAIQQRYLENFWQRVGPLLSPHFPPP